MQKSSEAKFNIHIRNDDVLPAVRSNTAPQEPFRKRRTVELNKSSVQKQAKIYGGKTATTNDFLHEIDHMMGLNHPGKRNKQSSTGKLRECEADRESLMGLGMEFRIDDLQTACCSKIKSKNKYKADRI